MSEDRSRPGMLGRADLIRVGRLGDPGLVADLAAMLGYSPPAPPPVQGRAPAPRSRRGRKGTTRGESPPVNIHVDFDLWYASSYQLRPDISPDIAPSSVAREFITDDTGDSAHWTDPGHHHLCPKAVLLTRLRAAAPSLRIGGGIDVGRIVHEWSRGKWLRRLPRARRRTWGRSLQLFVDRSRRLIPYWDDQNYVVHWLGEAFPQAGLATVLMREGDFAPSVMTVGDEVKEYEPPAPGSLVVAMSDLGVLAGAGSELPRLWVERGRRLRESGVRPLALVPCCRARIPAELLKVWDVLPWELPAGEEPPALDEAATRGVVERILTLLSFTLRIEPRLIRYVRRLLPEGRGDPGIEALVWSHKGFDEPSWVSAALSLDWAASLRERLANEDRSLRAEVQSRVEQLHREVYPGIWYAELSHLPDDGLVTPRQLEEARHFFAEQTRRLDEVGRDEDLDPMEVWLNGISERLLPQAYRGRLGPVLHRVWALSHRDEPDARPRDGMDPRLIVRAGEPPSGEERLLEIRQEGDRLIARPARFALAPEMGSLLGLLRSRNGEIEVTPIDDFWAGGVEPDWATAWGWDDFGAWCEFRVGVVSQRMRWIPPGTFRMGSSVEEEGRFENEGPQHDETISAGFWIFETPCTQALWEAVMESNPSEFRERESNRPVENVSWDECHEFLGRLNGRSPGLSLSLPSEAQWEYACRAGTAEATYAGPIEILGANNAPVLDPIAWYGGNSGIDFDLTSGFDASSWPEKQYPFSRAGTHPVARKQPNPWGLYDMLGNVWEWCADAWRGDYSRPVPPASPSARRVIRGGSWYDGAWRVGAAHRLYDDPSSGRSDLGFRCAELRSPGPAGRGRDAERAGNPSQPKGRSPGEDGEPASGADWLRLSGRDEAAVAVREVRPLRLRSDVEVLTLSTLRRPEWAAAIGRDGFGLWTDFEVEGVKQRLRWIPPGRFLMGSPDDEPGRYPDEGPRREVMIEAGFWIFDTPCTQALWGALMPQNPSRFQSPDRPVEQVDWRDAQRFASMLSQRIGLDLRLPSEAQWEYACRAGTAEATYAGPIEILGANNAPVLDHIAWYGGNSGIDFDLTDGLHAEDWVDKQYPFSRAGTHPVARKRPNPWGLYDMLGNVWEWCADPWRENYSRPVPVPSTWPPAHRVIRGGPWSRHARFARAACRHAHEPTIRIDYLGFRCAEFREGGVSAERNEPVERGAGARSGPENATRRTE